MHTAIADLERAQIRQDIPAFRPGDQLKVHVRVVEGSRTRIQVFQGVVIRPFPKRLGAPSEFADAAVFLLTNGYINGEVMRLDGAQRFTPK